MTDTKKKSDSHSHKKSGKKWVRDVKTVSTFPPKDTFNRPAEEVARIMARPKISPKGLGSAIRMVQYFINRGGKKLPASQKRELEKAKHILQEKRDAKKSPKRDHADKKQTKSQRTAHKGS
jgi:tRNA(adenine34) deaminase